MNKEFFAQFLPKDGEWKYRMLDDYSIDVKRYGIQPLVNVNLTHLTITRQGILTLKKGFVWNGASGGVDTPNFIRGSAVHDALYYLIRNQWLPMSARKKADKVLRIALREDGMNWFRAWYVYHNVRLWGGRTV